MSGKVIKLNKKKKEPPQDKAVRVSRTIRGALLVLLALVLLFSAFFFRDYLNVYSVKRLVYSLKSGNYGVGAFAEVELSYDTALSPRCALSKEALVLASSGEVIMADFIGNVPYYSKVQMVDPLITTSGKQVLVFDCGGKILNRYSNFKSTLEVKTQESITDAEINRYGEIVCVTSGGGYKSTITVLSARGNEVYKRRIAEAYVAFADIADDGDNFAAASFFTSNGELQTRLTMFVTDEQDPVGYVDFPGELAVSLKYMSDGRLFFLTDAGCYVFGADCEMISNFDFSGRRLEYFSATETKTAVLLNRNALGSNTNLLVFDSKGNCLFDVYVGREVSGMQFTGDAAVLESGNALLVYDREGEQTGDYIIDSSVKEYLASSETGVVGVYLNKAAALDIKV